ncbi:MAG: hypothetical protein GDA49_09855 [Rhodospirillales bacterium]|nr:hypothetical protein [Rhodospirillales bacterium]
MTRRHVLYRRAAAALSMFPVAGPGAASCPADRPDGSYAMIALRNASDVLSAIEGYAPARVRRLLGRRPDLDRRRDAENGVCFDAKLFAQLKPAADGGSGSHLNGRAASAIFRAASNPISVPCAWDCFAAPLSRLASFRCHNTVQRLTWSPDSRIKAILVQRRTT